jgi:hypothetical protein
MFQTILSGVSYVAGVGMACFAGLQAKFCFEAYKDKKSADTDLDHKSSVNTRCNIDMAVGAVSTCLFAFSACSLFNQDSESDMANKLGLVSSGIALGYKVCEKVYSNDSKAKIR